MTSSYSPRLQQLVAETLIDIESTLSNFINPLVAYSGGKDGNVVMHLVNRIRPIKGVCETSFYFQRQKQDVEQTIANLNYDVEIKDSLDWAWLSKHQNIIFANDSKNRSKSFAMRQQAVVANHAHLHNHDVVIFGRRTQENNVKSKLY